MAPVNTVSREWRIAMMAAEMEVIILPQKNTEQNQFYQLESDPRGVVCPLGVKC
jgi:hypothetical protein